jgi:hypothetical protein
MTAEDYLRRVEFELRDLPWGMRRELVSELRGHLFELPSDTDLEERLGSPAEYAADLRGAAGLERRGGPIAFVRARRLRNVILTVVAAAVVALTAGAVAWIETYQPLAYLGPSSVRGHVFVAFHQHGRPFRLGVDVQNSGRFTVRVLGVPSSSGPFAGQPVSAQVMMSRDVGALHASPPCVSLHQTAPCGVYVALPRGPYEPFQPFDLKPGQIRSLLLVGSFGNCDDTYPPLTLLLKAFPVRFGFLWKTETAGIPLPKERAIIPPNRGCRAASARFPFHTLKGGQRHVFTTGTIKIGTRIFCASHGVRAGALVPRRGQSVVGLSAVAGVYVPSGGATIHLTTRADGSVLARCR